MASKIDDPKAFNKLVGLSRSKDWLQADRESYALVELWNLCDLRQQQDLICSLLDNYTFINSTDLKEIGHKVVEQIEKVWGLCPGNTKIVALSEGAEADGSQMFLQSLKNKFEAPEWTEANFINSLPIAMHKAVNDDNLVLVDDFIGTGFTAERKVTWLFTELARRGIQNVKSYLVTTAGMEFARSRLDNLGIEYYSPNWLKRGISDRFDEGRERGTSFNISIAFVAFAYGWTRERDVLQYFNSFCRLRVRLSCLTLSLRILPLLSQSV